MKNLINKKKGILSKNLIGLIIAVFILILLFIFFMRILSPEYDPQKETLNSYLKQLKNSIKETDTKEISDFSIFIQPNSEHHYFLVYFKDKMIIKDFKYETTQDYYEVTGLDYAQSFPKTINYYTNFLLNKINQNTLCICFTSTKYKEDHTPSTKQETTEPGHIIKNYFSESNCEYCTELNYPAEFNKKNNNENIYDLSKHSFLIRKQKASNVETKYLFEIKEK